MSKLFKYKRHNKYMLITENGGIYNSDDITRGEYYSLSDLPELSEQPIIKTVMYHDIDFIREGEILFDIVFEDDVVVIGSGGGGMSLIYKRYYEYVETPIKENLDFINGL